MVEFCWRNKFWFLMKAKLTNSVWISLKAKSQKNSTNSSVWKHLQYFYTLIRASSSEWQCASLLSPAASFFCNRRDRLGMSVFYTFEMRKNGDTGKKQTQDAGSFFANQWWAVFAKAHLPSQKKPSRQPSSSWKEEKNECYRSLRKSRGS